MEFCDLGVDPSPDVGRISCFQPHERLQPLGKSRESCNRENFSCRKDQMRISIHQPSTYPYLGLFDKIQGSDIFVFLPSVQYIKNEFKNRNKIFYNPPGSQNVKIDWITIPVMYKFGFSIKEIRISEPDRVFKKHFKILESSYSKTKGFQLIRPRLKEFFDDCSKNVTFLSDFNILSTTIFFELLGLRPNTMRDSDVLPGMDINQDPTLRIIDICKALGADEYLAGEGAKGYMDWRKIEEAGIKVVWQSWHPVEYSQIHSPQEFKPYLSVWDFLFNAGKESPELFKNQCSLSRKSK